MTTLFLILITLFLTLAIVVKLAERFGKPMSPEDSQQMSKIIVVLVGLVLLTSAFKFFWS